MAIFHHFTTWFVGSITLSIGVCVNWVDFTHNRNCEIFLSGLVVSIRSYLHIVPRTCLVAPIRQIVKRPLMSSCKRFWVAAAARRIVEGIVDILAGFQSWIGATFLWLISSHERQPPLTLFPTIKPIHHLHQFRRAASIISSIAPHGKGQISCTEVGTRLVWTHYLKLPDERTYAKSIYRKGRYWPHLTEAKLCRDW